MTDELDVSEGRQLLDADTAARERLTYIAGGRWQHELNLAEEALRGFLWAHREALIAAAEEHANQSALRRRVEALAALVMNEPRNVALERLAEENEALRRCVEAADEVYVDTTTMLMRARVDRYKEAHSALDALRSGKPERKS